MSKRISNRELDRMFNATKQALHASPGEKDIFWSSFKARAALTHQEQPESGGKCSEIMPGLKSYRWHLAAAAVAVLVFAVTVGYLMQSHVSDDAPRLASAPDVPSTAQNSAGMAAETAAEPLCEVREVEVFIDYASMIIVQDEELGGTFLLLADAGGSPSG